MESWGNKQYIPAMLKVAEVLEIPVDQFTFAKDSHQMSTIEAGKSGCTGIFYNTPSMSQSMEIVKKLHEKLPHVNFEIHVNPDGASDQGDGPGSYALITNGPQKIAIPKNGFNCCILIDAQNILREMKFLDKSINTPASSGRPAQR